MTIYRSAYQWARRGWRPIAGTRSYTRGNIGQPLFGDHQVRFVGVYSAMRQHGEWQARNEYRHQQARAAINSQPADGLIYVNGRWYREV